MDRIEKLVNEINTKVDAANGVLSSLMTQGENIMGSLQDMENALNTIQKANAEIAKDLETIAANQKKLAGKLGAAAAAGGAAKHELEQLTKQAEEIAADITETEQKADAASGGSAPGHALPTPPAHVGGGPAPGRPDRPDAGLPPEHNRPDAGLPNAPVRPDAGLPPGTPAKPDAGLPPTGQPKK